MGSDRYQIVTKRGPVCNANLGQRWASGPVFWAR
nr:MAG TPA: hypothetical protein [Caudoviricetes sp.]